MLPENAGSIADVAGRGTAAVGRGMEAVGTSAPAKSAGGFGAMEAALRMDPKGVALAAAPKALELSGQGLQKVGRGLRSLKAAVEEPRVPITKAEWEAKAANDFPYQRGEAPTMESAPDQNPGELYPYQRDSLAALKNVSGNMTPASNEGAAAAEIGHPGAQAVMDRSYRQNSPVVDKMSLEGAFGPEQKGWAENKYGGPGVQDLSQDDALAINDELQGMQQLSPLDKLARASARSRALRSGGPIAPEF